MISDIPARCSILLSTYRSDSFLAEWIRSIRQQTIWPDLEVIIVANEPSTKEKELLSDFARIIPGRIHWETVSRESLYRSWNRAIERSSAPLLAIGNADDLRFPDSLQQQIEAMESHEKALFCYGPFFTSSFFPDLPDPDSTNRLVPVPAYDPVEFTRSMCLGPFLVWRKNASPSTRFFDEQFQSGGDFDFTIRLALHGHGIRMDKPLGCYYNAGLGLSTGSSQPIERTVIELRYGIYDKIDYRWAAKASRYNILNLLHQGEWLPVRQFVPDYDHFLDQRYDQWHRKGISRFMRRLLIEKMLFLNSIRCLKQQIRKHHLNS